MARSRSARVVMRIGSTDLILYGSATGRDMTGAYGRGEHGWVCRPTSTCDGRHSGQRTADSEQGGSSAHVVFGSLPAARCPLPARSLTHVNARIAAGKPSVVIARTQTCASSSSVIPAARALRTAECVPPSNPAPTERATFTRRRVFSSSGPALWHLSARVLNASQTSACVVRKSATKGGTFAGIGSPLTTVCHESRRGATGLTVST